MACPLQVQREHYLRDDISSGTPLDPASDPAANKLSAHARHYLLVDTNVALSQVLAGVAALDAHWGKSFSPCSSCQKAWWGGCSAFRRWQHCRAAIMPAGLQYGPAACLPDDQADCTLHVAAMETCCSMSRLSPDVQAAHAHLRLLVSHLAAQHLTTCSQYNRRKLCPSMIHIPTEPKKATRARARRWTCWSTARSMTSSCAASCWRRSGTGTPPPTSAYARSSTRRSAASSSSSTSTTGAPLPCMLSQNAHAWRAPLARSRGLPLHLHAHAAKQPKARVLDPDLTKARCMMVSLRALWTLLERHAAISQISQQHEAVVGRPESKPAVSVLDMGGAGAVHDFSAVLTVKVGPHLPLQSHVPPLVRGESPSQGMQCESGPAPALRRDTYIRAEPGESPTTATTAPSASPPSGTCAARPACPLCC